MTVLSNHDERSRSRLPKIGERKVSKIKDRLVSNKMIFLIYHPFAASMMLPLMFCFLAVALMEELFCTSESECDETLQKASHPRAKRGGPTRTMQRPPSANVEIY